MLVGGVVERNVIATVDSPTQITLTTNVGTGGIADDTLVSVVPMGFYNATVSTLNARDYGAVGNDYANDTPAIQAALNAAAALSPAGRVVLPGGIYKITGPLTIDTNGVALLGQAGLFQPTLRCSTADSGIVIRKSGGAVYQAEIGNLCIACDGVGDTGLLIGNASECYFHDLLIASPDVQSILIEAGAAQGIHSFARVAMNCDATDANGMVIQGGAGFWITQCNFYGGKHAFDFGTSVSSVYITDSWFEAWEDILNFDHSAAPRVLYNLVLQNCYLLSTKGGGSYTGRVVRCVTDNNTYQGVYHNIQIIGCYLATTATKYAIDISWNTGVGAGASRYSGTLRDNFYAGSNMTAWLYSEPANTALEFVRIMAQNNRCETTQLPIQDGTTRAYVAPLLASYGNAAPGDGPWLLGDIVWNADPAATEYIGWVCVVAGTPGTWKGFGAIQA